MQQLEQNHCPLVEPIPSVVELLNQQQVLQRDTNAIISKFSELQTQYTNGNFLADLQT